MNDKLRLKTRALDGVMVSTVSLPKAWTGGRLEYETAVRHDDGTWTVVSTSSTLKQANADHEATVAEHGGVVTVVSA